LSNNVAEVDKNLKFALDYAVEKRLVCSITRDMMSEPRTPFITEELKPLNNIDLPTFVGLLAYGYE
jgi:hypothetical protein